jgi:hypothetical protein
MGQEQKRELHHVVGTSFQPGGVAYGCAHSDTELKNYIDFGKLPNPGCPAIERWNGLQSRAALSGDNT